MFPFTYKYSYSRYYRHWLFVCLYNLCGLQVGWWNYDKTSFLAMIYLQNSNFVCFMLDPRHQLDDNFAIWINIILIHALKLSNPISKVYSIFFKLENDYINRILRYILTKKMLMVSSFLKF